MGQKNSQKKNNINNNINDEKLKRTSFEFLNIIGRGGFGRVWKVYSRKYCAEFAMKEMSKTKIIDKKSEKSVKYERDLLAIMHHPFIINMHFCFQDNDFLYIGMDLLTGGDLRYHLVRRRKFNEEETKFFMGCIILTLEYLHINNIIHRDLKPENLVLNKNGYVKLTDFGIAKIYQKENFMETSGTPGYMAPEVMCCQNHTHAVDYFALGVIGYEFMIGTRPYLGKNRKEIKEKIMARQAKVKPDQIPKGWSIESADFINKLLQRKPNNRLGLSGSKEIKEHIWLKNFNWKDLYLGKIKAPFIPKQGGENYDFKYCNAGDKIGIKTEERYYQIKNSSKYIEAFRDFYYFNRYSYSDNEDENKRKINIKNPHKIYEEEEKNIQRYENNLDNENNNNNIKKMILRNKSIDNNYFNKLKNNNLFKKEFENEKNYLILRRGASAKSTNILLKEYRKNKSLNSSLQSRRGNSTNISMVQKK